MPKKFVVMSCAEPTADFSEPRVGAQSFALVPNSTGIEVETFDHLLHNFCLICLRNTVLLGDTTIF